MQAVTSQSTRSAYDRLPRRLKKFVDQYVIGDSAADAYRKTGYIGPHARGIAHKWLKKPFVAAAIEEANQKLVADTGVRQATVLKQMHAIATSDVRKLFDDNGNLLPPHLLDEATRAAIASIEVEEISTQGREGTRYKYKFWDKVKANDRLGQFVKLWDAKSTTVNVDARSVTLNAGGAAADALQQLADITRAIAALGAGDATAAEDPHRSVLPAQVCDGAAGRGASVDVPEDSGDPE